MCVFGIELEQMSIMALAAETRDNDFNEGGFVSIKVWSE